MFTPDQVLYILDMDEGYNCPAKFKKYLSDEYAYVMVEDIMLKVAVNKLVDKVAWNKANPPLGPTYVLETTKGNEDNE